MSFENMEVSKTVEELEASFWRGINDGVESYNHPLPPWTRYSALEWNPYQQGYWFGRMLERVGRDAV
jgi:hypothetical protein